MSNRKLMILGIVAALMVVLVVIQGRMSRVPARTSSGGGYLIQGLEPGQIESIVVGKGDNPVRLFRPEGKRFFVVGNKDDYPALTSKINNLITSCLDIRTMEWVTANPANHESLHVTEKKAQNVVKFLNEKEEVITGVVIGTSRLPELQVDKRSTYVRLISSNDVYEAKNVPLLGGSATDYVDKEIVDVSLSEVARVAVTGPEGSYTLRVDDSNEDNIILEDMPAGKKLKTSDCEQVLLGLSSLSFDDVKKESSFEGGKLRFDNTYVSGLKDATIYTFKIAEADGKTYVKCSAEYMGETRGILESKEELEDKEAKLVAHDRAIEFTRRHQGWVYEVSEWKAKKLTRKLTELLEDEKEEEKGDEPASTGSEEEAKSESLK